eukprot:184113_1
MENKYELLYDEEPSGNDEAIIDNIFSIIEEEAKENIELVTTNNIDREEMKAFVRDLAIDNKNTTTLDSAKTTADELKLYIEIAQHDKDNDDESIFCDDINMKQMDVLMVNINDFVEIQVDDYESCGPSIAQCNAMKRILHLLSQIHFPLSENFSADSAFR